jgi:hypothetical protein
MKSRRFRTLHLPRTLAKAAKILGFWFSRSRLFPAVLGTRDRKWTAATGQRDRRRHAAWLHAGCSSVGTPGWATSLLGAQRAYAGEDRCDDRHRVRVRCRPGWPGAHSCPQCLQGHAGSCVRRRLDPCCISLIRSCVSSRLCPRDQRSGGRPSGSRLGRWGRSACRRRARGSAR